MNEQRADIIFLLVLYFFCVFVVVCVFSVFVYFFLIFFIFFYWVCSLRASLQRRRRDAALEEDSSSAPLDYSTTTSTSSHQYMRTFEMFSCAGGSLKHLSWLTSRSSLVLCMRAHALCSMLYLCLLNIHISMYVMLLLLVFFWWLMILWRRQCRRCGSADFWELNNNGWSSVCRC